MDDRTYRRLFLSCQCGATFRSYQAEARHRHNFPLLCRKKRARAPVKPAPRPRASEAA